MSDALEQFRNEYLQIPTESPEHAAQRELAEHCVDLWDDYEDFRCEYKGNDGGIPVTPEERRDCRRYAEEIKDEMYGFASLLAPLERHEWNQMVIWAAREKDYGMRKRRRQ